MKAPVRRHVNTCPPLVARPRVTHGLGAAAVTLILASCPGTWAICAGAEMTCLGWLPIGRMVPRETSSAQAHDGTRKASRVSPGTSHWKSRGENDGFCLVGMRVTAMWCRRARRQPPEWKFGQVSLGRNGGKVAGKPQLSQDRLERFAGNLQPLWAAIRICPVTVTGLAPWASHAMIEFAGHCAASPRQTPSTRGPNCAGWFRTAARRASGSGPCWYDVPHRGMRVRLLAKSGNFARRSAETLGAMAPQTVRPVFGISTSCSGPLAPAYSYPRAMRYAPAERLNDLCRK
jgi:hypothetical protein